MNEHERAIHLLKLCLEDRPYAETLVPTIMHRIQDAVAILEKQEAPAINAGTWINVNDDLPRKGEKVVVSDGIHTWDVGQYQGLCYTPGRTDDSPRRDFWDWKKNTVKTVKWWMPKEKALPEPPKEET